jgi:hypothetical protein
VESPSQFSEHIICVSVHYITLYGKALEADYPYMYTGAGDQIATILIYKNVHTPA